jgi:DNA-binding response OmpR family regulator
MLSAASAAPRFPVVTVLSVSPAEDDQTSLQAIFDRSETRTESKWRVERSSSVDSALAELQRRQIPLVFVERDLPPYTWKAILAGVAGQPKGPMVVVISRLADDTLWAEALNLGAYDVLAKPFDPDEVLRVSMLGWLRWARAHDIEM